VAEVVDREAGEEVDVALAVRVPQDRTLAAHECDGEAGVHADLSLVGRGDDLSVRHLASVRFAGRLRACCQVTSVPMPSAVKISSSTAWRRRPSITCVFLTPPRSASTQHSTFGIIPWPITPCWMSSLT